MSSPDATLETPMPLASDTRTSDLTGRAREIADDVATNRGHIWDAFDQGRLAHSLGRTIDANPWDTPIGRSHVNCHDWRRGWEAEQMRAAISKAQAA